MRHLRVWTVVLASAGYIVVGFGFAILAGMASSPTGVKTWRLAAWLFSLLIFGVHLAIERPRHGSRRAAAVQVALAVALGALGVAILGPFRAHWGEPNLAKLALLSLVAWPLLTGVPAFVVALTIGVILDRVASDKQEARA